MTQYYHLQIFKSLYEFTIELNTKIKKFKKYHRYTIGEKLFNLSLESCVGVYRANSAKNLKQRMEHVSKILEYIQTIFILLRISVDTQAITKENYSSLLLLLKNCEKQLFGWLSYCESLSHDK